MTGECIWVGIDAGVDRLSLCATDERGEVLREATVAASASEITDQLIDFGGCGVIIGIEAGSTAIPLTRSLREIGFEVRVLETRQVSQFLQMRQNKTDRNDARGIAQVTRLGAGIISEVLVKSSQCQRLRSELVLRVQLMRQRVAIENAIRAVLRLNDAKTTRSFSGAHLERSVQAELARLRNAGNDVTEVLTPALQIAVALRRALEQGSRRLTRIANSNDVCRRLLTVPGIGVISALSFYTAIEDPDRFKCSDDVGAYLGLVPKVSESGKSSRYGRITRMGNTMTRTHLVTAAKSLMQQARQDCQLRRWAISVAQRRGRPKARTALARKMAVVMLAMWKSGEAFNPEMLQRRSRSPRPGLGSAHLRHPSAFSAPSLTKATSPPSERAHPDSMT